MIIIKLQSYYYIYKYDVFSFLLTSELNFIQRFAFALSLGKLTIYKKQIEIHNVKFEKLIKY